AQTEQLAVLASDLEARRRQLQALNVAGMALTSELDSSAVLQKVADEARRVASARYAALGVFDDEGVVQLFVTSGLTPEERARIGPLPKGRGLLGLLQREPHPLRVAEISKHPASVGFPKGHPPMHSFLGTPILWRGSAARDRARGSEGGARAGRRPAQRRDRRSARLNARLTAEGRDSGPPAHGVAPAARRADR